MNVTVVFYIAFLCYVHETIWVHWIFKYMQQQQRRPQQQQRNDDDDIDGNGNNGHGKSTVEGVP